MVATRARDVDGTLVCRKNESHALVLLSVRDDKKTLELVIFVCDDFKKSQDRRPGSITGEKKLHFVGFLSITSEVAVLTPSFIKVFIHSVPCHIHMKKRSAISKCSFILNRVKL